MALRPEDLKFNPPSFGHAAVGVLLAEQYDLRGDLEALEGERDQNLLLTTPTPGLARKKPQGIEKYWKGVSLLP